jgi:hypothetical protein
MNRLSISTWHEGNPGCDQFVTLPMSLTKEEALGLALFKLQCNPSAIQVEIEFEDTAELELDQRAA